MQAVSIPKAQDISRIPTLDLNPTRILATAGAIALHIAVLGLLLVPVTVPSPPASNEETVTFLQWLTPPPVVFQPPAPAVPVRKAQTPRNVQAQPQTQTRPDTSNQSNVIVATQPETDQTSVISTSTQTETTFEAVASNPPGLHLISGPKPAYPRQALLARQEGVVKLLVVVNGQGRAQDVSIAKSSGYALLDRAARTQVLKNWIFEATGATQSATLEINFALE